MTGSLPPRRLLVSSIVILLAVACGFAAVVAGCGDDGDGDGASPSPAASTSGKPDFSTATASPSPTGVTPVDVEGDLLVVRREGKSWTAWRVTPATGAEQRVGEIGFEPTAAIPSPNRRFVAYQAPSWRKKFALTLAVLGVQSGKIRTITVEGSRIKELFALTWLSDTQLLVSGMPPGPKSGPEVDLLAKVDVRTGAARPFRGLQGSDPNAAPAANTLVYVTAEKAPEGGDGYDGPAIREVLMTTSVSPGDTPREVVDGFGPDPELTAAHRVMASPLLSPDGTYVLTAETGSDIDLTYTLHRMDNGSRVFKLHAPGQSCSVWSADGRVALWGLGRTESKLRVWVYDVGRDGLSRSRVLRDVAWVTGLDWSPRGDLAIGVRWGTEDDVEPGVRIAIGGDLEQIVEVTAGDLPVWID